MPTRNIRFEASATIHASPAVVWDILTDYRNGHPKILPPQAFSDFTVLEGGKGAGTVISFVFRVAGARRAVRSFVSEPQPGSVLMEAEHDGATVTNFTLAAVDEGRQTRLTITTVQRGSPGVRGAIERLFMPMVAPAMQRIYQDEMQRLDALAHQWPRADG